METVLLILTLDEPNSLIDNEREMTQHDWCLNNWQQNNKDYIMNKRDTTGKRHQPERVAYW